MKKILTNSQINSRPLGNGLVVRNHKKEHADYKKWEKGFKAEVNARSKALNKAKK